MALDTNHPQRQGRGSLSRGNAESHYFGVWAFYGRTEMYDLLVNTGDPYDGRVMFSHENANLIEVQADGAWSITTEK